VSDAYTCSYRYKCCCYCALLVKTYADKVEIALAGEHTASSHTRSSCILSVKQRSAVKRAVRSSPHAVGSQVHANLENFSPGHCQTDCHCQIVKLIMRKATCPAIQTMQHRRLIGASAGMSALNLVMKLRAPFFSCQGNTIREAGTGSGAECAVCVPFSADPAKIQSPSLRP
jgi:hypothetical protein